MNTTTDSKTVSRALPADLADVALIDAQTCAAAGAMSISWWYEEVRACRAPKPVIQQPRCTRWRLADVKAYWIERAAQNEAKATISAAVVAKAQKASAAAKLSRNMLGVQ